MKARLLIAASIGAAALAAYAGEDSTDRSGSGGTGPAFYESPCGLAGFTGPGDRTAGTPCPTLAQGMSVEQMRAWMDQHGKAMEDMLNRMKDEHRAILGSSGSRGGR